jgi:hypothetical protein
VIALISCNIINPEEEDEEEEEELEKVVEYKKLWLYADNIVIWKLFESTSEIKL